MSEDSGYNDHRVENQLKELLLLATGHDCGAGSCRQARRAMAAMKEILRAEFARGLKEGRQEQQESWRTQTDVSDERLREVSKMSPDWLSEEGRFSLLRLLVRDATRQQAASVLALTTQLEEARGMAQFYDNESLQYCERALKAEADLAALRRPWQAAVCNPLLWLILRSTRQNFGTDGEKFLREQIGLPPVEAQ